MLHLADLLRVAAPSRRPRPSVAPAALAADTRGVAALELALILPFMILLLMGVFDFASVAYDTMQVNAAAYAGAHAAVAAVQPGGSGSCTPSVITSAEAAATSLTNLTTSSTKLSGVSSSAPACGVEAEVVTTTNNGSTSSTLTPCTGTGCTATPGYYAVAYAQATYTPLLSWSALVLPKSISATAVVRYQ